MSEEAGSSCSRSSSPEEPSSGSGQQLPPDEDSVTMLDVLQEEEELDEDADAVLGNTDDKHCSYSQGYVKRQPLYACLTCQDKDHPAGICLACSYHCHGNHELVELYTKRNFRCDCGGIRQPDMTCRLAAKTGDNQENTYNQNYAGLYCTCHRPYPDPEDTREDEMIQCAVCEDWYHGRHLGAAVPEDGAYTEMTCAGCVERLPFLRQYVSQPEMAAGRAEVKSAEDAPAGDSSASCRLPGSGSSGSAAADSGAAASGAADSGATASGAADSGAAASRPADSGALFWRAGWRRLLCACDACRERYAAGAVLFLLEEEDSVADYERRGRGGSGSYAQGMRALSSMERTQQVEVVTEYNDLKSELMSYLQKFAENKKVVRKEDIDEFFSGMKSRKRQRTEPPPFCR